MVRFTLINRMDTDIHFLEHNIFITKSILECLKYYFDVNPFFMQAAFALSEINEREECSTILLSEFVQLADKDYEHRSQDEIHIYTKSLMDVLHGSSHTDRLSLIFIHSHASPEYGGFDNEDHRMIFRLSYAYMPFGKHASLYYTNGELSGKVWLPNLKTAPLQILYE